jgi:hypothetical protein
VHHSSPAPICTFADVGAAHIVLCAWVRDIMPVLSLQARSLADGKYSTAPVCLQAVFFTDVQRHVSVYIADIASYTSTMATTDARNFPVTFIHSTDSWVLEKRKV